MTRVLRVLVVDDELDSIDKSVRFVSAVPGFEIAGVAETGAAAVEKVRALRPDLVLLDIGMPEMTGLEVVRSLGDEMPLTTFVTAYDEHAVAAFEEGALDYLVKPFDRDRFNRSLDRARERIAGREVQDVASRLAALERASGPAYPTHVLVNGSGTKLVRLAAEEIEWIESADNYVRIHMGGKSFLHRTSLRELEERLDPSRFVRIRHSAMVNVAHIAAVVPWSSTEYEIEMRSGARLNSTRLYRQRVRSLIL